MYIDNENNNIEAFLRTSWDAAINKSGRVASIHENILPFSLHCAEPTYSEYANFFQDANKRLREICLEHSADPAVNSTHVSAGYFVGTGRYRHCLQGIILRNPWLEGSCLAVGKEVVGPYWRLVMNDDDGSEESMRRLCADFHQGVMRSLDTVDDGNAKGAFFTFDSEGQFSALKVERRPGSAS